MVKDSTQRAAAIDGLEYISQLVRRFVQIENIYFLGEGLARQDGLETAITKLYTQILEYEARAACQFNRKTGHQTLRNIIGADSWDSILGTIKKSEEECDKRRAIIDKGDQQTLMQKLDIMLTEQSAKVNELREASRAQDEALLAGIKAIREDQKASFQNEKEANCHRCFRVANYESTKDNNTDRVPGTCEWFLQHPRYTRWLNEPASKLLWVTADPGCGKSVLSKFLVHDYRSWMWKDTSICYFFFKDNSEENRSATHALCSILHQLFLQKPALLKHALSEFDANGNDLCRLFRTLWSILLRAAADPDSSGIVCILDALDECSEPSWKQIVEHLTDFQSTAHEQVKIKFLVTSRPNNRIWSTFSKNLSRHDGDLTSIQLMGENEEEMKEISAEIKLLVDAKVKELKKLRSAYGIKDDADVAVKAKLNKIEHRTYLWIALIFPELEELAGHAEDHLLEGIERIPSTVDEAYEKILSKSSNAQQARRLLHIVCAASRPLTLAEMNRALSIRDKDHTEALIPPESFRTYVRHLCGLFISIQNSSIYLIHQTAKEFLISGSTPEAPISPVISHEGPWKNSLEGSESHYVLAQICMSYFLSSEFESDPLNLKMWILRYDDVPAELEDYAKKHEFSTYAGSQWATHFEEAGCNRTKLSELALEMCNPQSRPFRTWLPFHITSIPLQSPPNNPHSSMLTMIHEFSQLAVEALFPQVLAQDDVKADSPDDGDIIPLHWAARYGYLRVMEVLLAQDDVNPNSTDKFGNTPLNEALRYHQTRAAELLLMQSNVDADRKNDHTSHRTPLSYAATCGNIDVVKLLLNRDDIDRDFKDDQNRTSLSYAAAESGDVNVVKLFLVQGAEADSKDVNHRTPLSYAAERGYNDDMMKLFLVRDDVEADSKDINNRTPLSYAAARSGNSATVRLLLAHGVEADSKDDVNRTPLSYAAAAWDNIYTVELLLVRDDVETDFKDINNRTPLSYAAAQRDNIRVVELLLAHSVKVNSKDVNNRTPLSYAAESGGVDVMRLLLAQGAEADFKDINNRTPLSYAAASWNSIDMMKLLLARDDVEADSKDINNRTPFSYAVAASDNIDVVELLLARGDVETDSKDIKNRTPLSYAAAGEKTVDVVKLLLARDDVEADSKDIENRTPLSYAAAGSETVDVMKLLFARDDVEADSKDINNRTPLSYAAEEGGVNMIEFLLAQGLEADSKDINNRTPLSYAAARFLTIDAVKVLLARDDVDPDSADIDGHTPTWWAESKRNYKIVALLRARKAAIAARVHGPSGSEDV